MDLKWKIHKWNFKPTDTQRVATEAAAYAIMDVHRGTLVKAVTMRVGTAWDQTPSAQVGDGDVGDAVANLGFMDYLTTVITADGLKNGHGHYLDQGLAGAGSNGKLYTEDDTIDLFYTGIAEQSVGTLEVTVIYCETE